MIQWVPVNGGRDFINLGLVVNVEFCESPLMAWLRVVAPEKSHSSGMMSLMVMGQEDVDTLRHAIEMYAVRPLVRPQKITYNVETACMPEEAVQIIEQMRERIREEGLLILAPNEGAL